MKLLVTVNWQSNLLVGQANHGSLIGIQIALYAIDECGWCNRRFMCLVENNSVLYESQPKYDLWLRNAPREATHMIVLRNLAGLPFPWYVLRGQSIEMEVEHFGEQRIIMVTDVVPRKASNSLT